MLRPKSFHTTTIRNINQGMMRPTGRLWLYFHEQTLTGIVRQHLTPFPCYSFIVPLLGFTTTLSRWRVPETTWSSWPFLTPSLSLSRWRSLRDWLRIPLMPPKTSLRPWPRQARSPCPGTKWIHARWWYTIFIEPYHDDTVGHNSILTLSFLFCTSALSCS